jgi:hypothetical protein
VLDAWLAFGFNEATRSAVRDWLWSFSFGPPDDAGLVFGRASSRFYDAEYFTARLNTEEGVIEARFVVVMQAFGAGEQQRIVFSYLGSPPPVDPQKPSR